MRLRRGWPMLLFVILVVAVPALEIWLLVQVGQRIGLLPTLLILFGEAVLGAWLMRREGSRAWQSLLGAFSTGRVPGGELADAALVLVGGVLLMLPGFATDVIGFLFLLPITRPLARRILAFFVARRIRHLGGPLASTSGFTGGGATVISGETANPEPSSRGPVIIRGEVDGPDRS